MLPTISFVLILEVRSELVEGVLRLTSVGQRQRAQTTLPSEAH